MENDPVDMFYKNYDPSKMKPSEFVFEILHRDDEGDEDALIIITPLKYFLIDNCCYDQELGIDHLLPDGVEEAMEGAYSFHESQMNKEELQKELLKRGFVKDQEFTKLVKNSF